MATKYSKLDVEKDELLEQHYIPSPKPRKILLAFFFLTLLSIYTALIIFLTLRIFLSDYKNICQNEFNNELLFSPAHEAAFYSTVIPDTPDFEGDMGPFTGNPGKEVDMAWKQLLSATNIRIAEKDVHRMNETSLSLLDKSGDQWGSLEVYHHLHCLMVIRHYIALDHYPADTHSHLFSKESGKVYPEHIEHCVESLRIYLTCQPDMTVMTYKWGEELGKPEPNYKTPRMCIDWDRLHGWALERSFSLKENLIPDRNGNIWIP